MKKMRGRIFGQDRAIRLICAVLSRRAAGLYTGHTPRASFLFYGPSGIGKTETCKALAEALGVSFIRFDMNEYSEAHTVSSLIGSPPGYVGYGDGGLLTKSVRRNPDAVVCFEYADKAPPEITGLFSQILEHGTLTDSRGKITDFSGATVVFTVSEQSESRPVSGFTGQDTKNNYVLPGHLTDKTDKTVEFDRLDNDSLIKIIDNRLKDIKKNCGAELTYTEDVCRVLLNKCGARNGRGALRAVEEYIEEPLSFVLLGDGICGVNIGVNGKDIDITGSKSLDKTAVLEYNQ